MQPVLSSGYHNTVPPQNGGGGSTFSAAAMVAAATATATATASVVAMQDRQDIPAQFNQVLFFPLLYLLFGNYATDSYLQLSSLVFFFIFT